MELLRPNLSGDPHEAQSSAMPTIFAERYVMEPAAAAGTHPPGRRATELSTGAPVALTFFSYQLVLNPADRAVAQQVISATQTLRHPGVVVATEVVMYGKDAAIVTPWVEGRTLRQVISVPATRFFGDDDLRRWLPPLMDIIEAAHADGIVHGALNPDVVLMEEGEVRVVGFGVNAWLRRVQYSRGPIPAHDDGLAYVSPAQRRGEKPCESDDIYALGVMIYQMIAGAPPRASWWRRIPGAMARERQKNGGRRDPIPSAWERAIRRCLEPREHARLGSVQDLRALLQLGPTGSVEPVPSASVAPASVSKPAPATTGVRAAPPPSAPVLETTPTSTVMASPPASAPAPALVTAPAPVPTSPPVPPLVTAQAAPPEPSPSLTPDVAPPLAEIAPTAPKHVQAEVPEPAREPTPVPERTPAAPPPPPAPMSAATSAPELMAPPSFFTSAPALTTAPAPLPTPTPVPALVTTQAAPLPPPPGEAREVPPPPAESAPPARVVVATQERVRAEVPVSAGAAAPGPARKADTGAWVPPPARVALETAPRTAPRTAQNPSAMVAPQRNVAPANGAPVPGTFLLRTTFVMIFIATLVVGSWLAWRLYQLHHGPPATSSDIRAVPLVVAEQPQVAEEAGLPAEGPNPLSVPEEDLSAEVQESAAKPLEEQPALVAPATGAIDVRSEPAGAEVRMVGRPPQRAPFRADSLAPGSYPVEVRLAGHAPYAATVDVVAGATAELDARLERLTGDLRVVSDPAGAAFVVRSPEAPGRAHQGVTPAELRLPTGRYFVDVRRDGAQQVCIVDVDTNYLAVARVTFPADPAASAEFVLPPRTEGTEGASPVATMPPSTNQEEAPATAPMVADVPVVAPAALAPATAINVESADRDSAEGAAEIPTAELADAEATRGSQPAAKGTDPSDEPVLTAVEGPPLEGGIWELGSVDAPPRLIERVNPVVRHRHFLGTERPRVELVVVIDRMGRVASAAVHSTTDESLVEPCLRAVRLWRFSPATKRGKAVPVRVAVPLVFKTS